MHNSVFLYLLTPQLSRCPSIDAHILILYLFDINENSCKLFIFILGRYVIYYVLYHVSIIVIIVY